MLRRTAPIVLASIAVVGGAQAARVPNAAEARAVVEAVREHIGARVAVASVRVSAVDPDFATVRWSRPTTPRAHWVELYRRAAGRWTFVWGRPSAARAEGACAFVPAAVARELYGTHCPGARALHARPADAVETPLLESAFATSAAARTYAYRTHLRSLCVSRLNSEWAAASTVLTETQGIVWFRRAGRWQVVYETLNELGIRPPRPIVLSLASCVGYNAAENGG
jgi:hypothetical protein